MPGDSFRFPKIRLTVELAGPRAADRFAGQASRLARSQASRPASRLASFEFDPAAVGALMAALDWEEPEPGEAERAANALSELLTAMVEGALWPSGYQSHALFHMPRAFEDLDPGWRERLEGAAPWAPGASALGAAVEARVALGTSSAVSDGALGAAELHAMHERSTQEFVATFLDQCGILGAAPVLSQTRGFGDWSQAISRLPEKWIWPRLGAAYGIELESGDVVCASFAPAALRRLAASPLGRALGPKAGFCLQSARRPMRLALSSAAQSKAYAYAALPGMPKTHFPCQVASARQAWRSEGAAGAREVMDALLETFGPRAFWALGVEPRAEARAGACASPAMEGWLAGCAARIQARALRKASAPAERSAKRSAGRL